VISISPVVPSPEEDKPYHQNIRIIDNVFDTVGVPLLYAFSCADLVFSQNRIFKSPSCPGEIERKEPIHLAYCRNVSVSKNQWIGEFSSIECSIDHCLDVESDI
jgi:hypothetical protein